jgi:hypothetical protein
MLRAALIALVLLTPSIALGVSRDVALTVSPENPEPGQAVRVTATTIGSDSRDTIFTWLVDDEIVKEGIGATTLDTTAPAIGVSKSIRVVTNGTERARPLILRPARVSLEWEALSERPPFYTGRPMVGGQGSVRVAAFAEILGPNGTLVPASDIRYTWRQRGQPLTALSGYGRDSVTLTTSFFSEPFTVSVEATTRAGVRATKTIQINPASLDVVIYETSPLAGVLDNRAIVDVFNFTANEVAFIAYPLNASRPESLTYTWQLNGSPVTLNTDDPRRAVFKKTGEGTGAFEVGVTLENPNSFLDLARRTFLLQF